MHETALFPFGMHLLAIEPFAEDFFEIYRRHHQRVPEHNVVFSIYELPKMPH